MAKRVPAVVAGTRCAGSVESGSGPGSITFLAIMLFRHDVAAGKIQRVIQALELACIDAAVGTEAVFHGADVTLLLHQPAELGAGQAASAHPGLDPFPLPILTQIDVLTVALALPVSMRALHAVAVKGAVTISISILSAASTSLCAGCDEAQAAERQCGKGFLQQSAFHGVAPLQLSDVAGLWVRQRTTAL
jgi:hypothetical protein